NTTFSIHITEPDNNSDAARTMVAINSYVEYFLDAMNTWMTQTGQTKIEMPNGEVVTLDSIKKMQGDIQNKADKSTTALQLFSGGVRAPYVDAIQGSDYFGLRAFNNIPSFYASFNGKGYNINVPIKQGTMMLVGDYGIGGIAPRVTNDELKGTLFSQFMAMGAGSDSNHFGSYGGGISIKQSEDASLRMFVTGNADFIAEYYSKGANVVRSNTMWGTRNTTTDPQGFIKKASPIVNINS
ncbi:hypothetical protein LZ636_18530, partial [Proteus terrae]|nr:hypothetical protein [Proteus terrae]